MDISSTPRLSCFLKIIIETALSLEPYSLVLLNIIFTSRLDKKNDKFFFLQKLIILFFWPNFLWRGIICGPKSVCCVFAWGSTTLAKGFFECTMLFDQHNFSLRSKERTNLYGSPICTSCHPSRSGLEIAFTLPLSITCPV